MKASVRIHHQARPSRKGVNLASRHARLLIQDDRSTTRILNNSKEKYSQTALPEQGVYFQGILIPQKPVPPSTEDCCMSNCRPCIHDLYLSTLTQYKNDIAYIRHTLEQRCIPIHTWPNEIRPPGSRGVSEGHQTSSESQIVDQAEMKAMKTAQEARTIMARQAKAKGIGAGGKSMFLEAGRLVFWVLKGCPE